MSDKNTLPMIPLTLPLLPLRDVVVYPHMVTPLFVGRAKSIKALEFAMNIEQSQEPGLHSEHTISSDTSEDKSEDKSEDNRETDALAQLAAMPPRRIALVAQKVAGKDEPKSTDVFDFGCVATILQMLKLPDGTVKVLIEGQQRARIAKVQEGESFIYAQVTPLPPDEMRPSSELEALRRAVVAAFEGYVKFNKKIPSEILTSISSIEHVGRMVDTITAHTSLKLEDKQNILAITGLETRLEALLALLERELEVLNVDKKIRNRIKKQVDKNQRQYYLNEQVKAIQKELGEGEEGADIEELEKKIKLAKMPKHALKKAEGEMKKLKLMSPMSAEATVIRNYIDTLVELPWSKKTKIKHDLGNAQDVLDADHFGLEKVKDRILEYLAVQQRVDKVKAPILCLVGPPGVGKTSLGQSVAKATGRKYVRMALGGVRDEAEIRGHRRTYIGALPGKILQNLSKAGTRNPLFLLDEIDKLSTDFRGDPSSALLEVLDPEQNHTFSDHYVDLDFDLSDVMFVATSNSLNIPPALLDRMEVIRLSGYTEDEKVSIAQRYLLPKQITNNGLKDGELKVSEAALRLVVRYFTREAGVRSLERELSKICRKVVKGVQLKTLKAPVQVTDANLDDFLGVRKFRFGRAEVQNQVGQVVGLAWTEVGGDLLTIESATMPGKGNVTRTGSLGDVMKESVEAARTVVRSRAERLGIAAKLFENTDIHIHVPDGATPKDGPSAGIAMTTAIVSALTQTPVRADLAMTGEITLRGEVTAIGGLKEKLLAALRGGIKTVLIPEDNVKDLADVPDNVKNEVEIIPVKWIDQVLEQSLVGRLGKLAKDGGQSAAKKAVAKKTEKTVKSLAAAGKAVAVTQNKGGALSKTSKIPASKVRHSVRH